MISRKSPSYKKVETKIWSDSEWLVKPGRLVPSPGRPAKENHLFKYVAEKLPFDSLDEVKRYFDGSPPQGVYLAHDSMGVARYGGRGDIFTRLRSHKKKYAKELLYYSFYVIANKKHEREIETAILRAAGPQMTLNTRKTALGLHPGNISDYEPGTCFFERQFVRGPRQKKQNTSNLRHSP